MATLSVALTGNPNTGKSTIFNELTGIRQKIGNWPGVTVDKKVGYTKHKDRAVLCQPDGFADASAGVEGLHQREGCAVFHVTPFESERIALGQVHGKFDGISGVLEVCVSRQLGL